MARALRHLAAGVVYAVAAFVLAFIASLLDSDAEGWRLVEVDE